MHTHVCNIYMVYDSSQGGGSGNGEEWLETVYIWKAASTEFPRRLDIGDERS